MLMKTKTDIIQILLLFKNQSTINNQQINIILMLVASHKDRKQVKKISKMSSYSFNKC